MPKEDAERWNKRYSNSIEGWTSKPRDLLVDHQTLLPSSGMALDIAMGPGLNADFLVRRGMKVIGVDISAVAVQQAIYRNPKINGIVADLTQFPLHSGKFDLVINFYYLQRTIWPLFRKILRPGGILMIETLTLEMNALRPDIEPSFLLQKNELREYFSDWEILFYREGWFASSHGNQKAIASLIAKLPSSLE